MEADLKILKFEIKFIFFTDQRQCYKDENSSLIGYWFIISVYSKFNIRYNNISAPNNVQVIFVGKFRKLLI